MLFSEADGRKVVSTANAETVGKIDDFVIDPASRSVLALKLKKTDTGSVLRWDAMTAFGADAVTVTGAEVITDADATVAELSGKERRIIGKRVLTAAGDELGKVSDVEFDAGTGEIIALHLGPDAIEGVRLIGLGSYAVVVRTR